MTSTDSNSNWLPLLPLNGNVNLHVGSSTPRIPPNQSTADCASMFTPLLPVNIKTMETANASASPYSNATPSRTDSALLAKCKNQLIQSRNLFGNYAKEYPGFNPQYMRELCIKLDEGITYAQRLAELNLEKVHDITISPGAARRKPPVVLLIDTAAGVTMMIEHIAQCHARDSALLDLYLDSEGDFLTGELSIVQIFVQSIDTVYLVDTLKLGKAAFDSTAPMCHMSLKDVLESNSIRKAFYGVIGDSHELWKNYGIYVAGIEDIHLMGIAAYGFKRRGGRKLSQCVQDNTKGEISEKERKVWIERKEWGSSVFKESAAKLSKINSGEESGDGWVPLFSVRPITREVQEYAVADVTILPILHAKYENKLPQLKDGDLWVARVTAKTEEHIVKSQSIEYDPNQKGESGVPEWTGLKY